MLLLGETLNLSLYFHGFYPFLMSHHKAGPIASCQRTQQYKFAHRQTIEEKHCIEF